MKPRSATAVAFYLTLAAGVCGGAVAANLVKFTGPLSPARAALAPDSTAHHGGTAGARPVQAGSTGTNAVKGNATSSQSAPAAASVSTLPGSGIVREPSMAMDSTGALFVTAPSNLQHNTPSDPTNPTSSESSSPLWKSTDGGVTWSNPVNTENGGEGAAGLGGAGSDIAIGPGDSIYVASTWTGNTSMAVSIDHGATFTQLPISHPIPVDSRPWLYYDPGTAALYMDWDGAGALHVGKALVNQDPKGQLVFERDVPARVDHTDRGCDTNCTDPGNVVVDPFGVAWVPYTSAEGLSVAYSNDNAPQDWTPATVPNTKNANVSNRYQVLRTDSAGNLYLVWTQMADSGTTVVYLSYLKHGDTTWHAPIAVSSSDAVFGTLAVVSPGVVDVAYYGTNGWHNNPGSAPASTSWDLYLTQVKNLFGTPAKTTEDLLPNMHSGSIAVGTVDLSNLNPDARLGNFFSMVVDAAGLADIVATVDDGSGSKLQFVHELPPPPPPTPGPQFMLPSPQAAAAAGQTLPSAYGPYLPHDAASAPTPTPDAGASGGDVATAATPSVDTGTTGRPSGPKYPDGVAVSTPTSAGVDGGTGGHGPALWVYLLAGCGGMVGRFVYKRGRG